MRVSGKTLRELQQELEITPAELCAEADISIGTLYNIYGERGVTANTVNRVRKALERLKQKAMSAQAVG